MKIIDLLNMIAKERIPQRIKFREETYRYSKKENDYVYEGDGNYSLFDSIFVLFELNEEIEIIEDEEEIDIQNIEELPKIIYISLNEADVRTEFNNIIDNQNKILQAVKKLDKQLKEK